MLNNSVKEVVEQPEHNLHNTSRPIGSRAIAGALVRMSTISNCSHEPQRIPSPIGWQEWRDWNNGHADS